MSASFCQPSPKPHFLHEEMCLLAGPHCKLEEVTLRKEGCNKNQTPGKLHPKPIQEPEHPNTTKREGRSLPFHKYLFRAIHQISASTAFSPKGVGGELSTFPHAPHSESYSGPGTLSFPSCHIFQDTTNIGDKKSKSKSPSKSGGGAWI